MSELVEQLAHGFRQEQSDCLLLLFFELAGRKTFILYLHLLKMMMNFVLESTKTCG